MVGASAWQAGSLTNSLLGNVDLRFHCISSLYHQYDVLCKLHVQVSCESSVRLKNNHKRRFLLFSRSQLSWGVPHPYAKQG